MRTTEAWAKRRRRQYGGGFFAIVSVLFSIIFITYFYQPSSCFDGWKNGNERGVDCGGRCIKFCLADVIEPQPVWAESFEIRDGQYNAVAYIENRNPVAATPQLTYTFTLYDEQGVITERTGTTILPPAGTYPIFEGRIMTSGRTPTRTEVVIDGGDLWIPAEVSADEFTLVGRELKNTDTEIPSLNARVRNDSLITATDVDVVATIFDATGKALTSSQTFVPALESKEVEPIVFTWPNRIATTIKSCEVPTDVVIAIDLSGSMNNDQDNPPEPISSTLRAASSFADRLGPNDQGSVVTYATNAEVSLQLTNEQSTVSQTIRDLVIAPEEEVGSTNTGAAIKLANQELNSNRHNLNARKVFVLMTDGLANEPEPEPEQYAQTEANALKETSAQIFTIGLGNELNEDFLRSLASSPQHYYHAPSIGQLNSIYESITAEICEEGPAVIEIVPKSDASFQWPPTQ